MKALDPLHLEAEVDGAMASDLGATKSKATEAKTNSPLLQNPNGATQMFNPVGGQKGEGAADCQAGRIRMGGQAGRMTVGPERAGVTDWQAGTDGGKSSKARGGVPYGSFAGV